MIASLTDQARRRLDMAHQLGRKAERWVASPEAVQALDLVDGRLHGLPVTVAATRSEWGLDLVLGEALGEGGRSAPENVEGHADLHVAQ